MKLIALVLILVLTPFLSASVTIATSANVSYAIKALIEDFSKLEPDNKIETILASSGKLTTQIEKGAPYDLFLSADMSYPHKLDQDGFTITKPKVYAYGTLVLMSFKGVKLDQNVSKTLLDNNIKKIAVANPKTAPYGKATKELLENLHFYEKLKNNFIYGDSISNAFVYTQRAADVGFVAKSLLYAPKLSHLKEGTHWIDLNQTLYNPIAQGVVLLKNASNNQEAKNFYNYLFSKRARAIFKKFGYEE